MMNLINILIEFLVLAVKLHRPGGLKAVVAENLVLRQQLIVVSRKNGRSPPLKFVDRFLFGLLAFGLSLKRLNKISIAISPNTILKFHKALVNKKYQILFGTKNGRRRGPKGFDKKIVDLVLEIKTKNLSFGCPRIAMLVANATGLTISEHTVRRILRKHFKPIGDGPSWLSFLASQKDSLWSIDFFRCESIMLKSYWVMLVIDVYTREIVGFKSTKASYDGPNACFMFNKILENSRRIPNCISTDHDPVFKFSRWEINLDMLKIYEVKSIPGVPMSHPFVERCIGTTRREFLDQVLFWTEDDLDLKLKDFQKYYNEVRPHYSLNGIPPSLFDSQAKGVTKSGDYSFKSYCNDMYSVPIAA